MELNRRFTHWSRSGDLSYDQGKANRPTTNRLFEHQNFYFWRQTFFQNINFQFWQEIKKFDRRDNEVPILCYLRIEVGVVHFEFGTLCQYEEKQIRGWQFFALIESITRIHRWQRQQQNHSGRTQTHAEMAKEKQTNETKYHGTMEKEDRQCRIDRLYCLSSRFIPSASSWATEFDRPEGGSESSRSNRWRRRRRPTPAWLKASGGRERRPGCQPMSASATLIGPFHDSSTDIHVRHDPIVSLSLSPFFQGFHSTYSKYSYQLSF